MGDIWTVETDDFNLWHDGANGKPMHFEDGDNVLSTNERSSEERIRSYESVEQQNGIGRMNAVENDIITISSSSTRSNRSQDEDCTPSASCEDAAKELER